KDEQPRQTRAGGTGGPAARTGNAWDRSADQTTPRPRGFSPQPPVTPPGWTPAPQTPQTSPEPASRRPAVVAASCLFVLGALAAIGSILYPGPVNAGGAIVMVPYVIAVVLAIWLLIGKRLAVVPAILLGMWAPAAGFLVADVVAIAVDHSFNYTGSFLASYYAGD